MATGSPSPELHCDPLTLRAYRPADETAFVELFQDPAVMAYVGDGLQSADEDRALFHRVFSHVYPEQKFAVWAVVLEDAVIGHAELKPSPRDDIDGWELVYIIGSGYWLRGFGRQVAGTVTRFGLTTLGLPAVYATVDTRNTASLTLLAAQGFSVIDETDEDDGSRVAILATSAVP
jgi:ribosomal-protein-alanine N-acetyltransferase